MNRKMVKKSLFVVAIGFLAATIILIYSDLRGVAAYIVHANLLYVLVVCLLIPMNFCIKCIRYHYYLRLSDLRISVRDEIFSLMAASVMVITPGKLGEVLMRGYLLKKRGYDVSSITICAMTIADRITEGIAMAVLALLTMTEFTEWIDPRTVCIVGGVLFLAVALLQCKAICIKVMGLLKKVRFLKKAIVLCEDAYIQAYAIFRFIPIVLSTFLGMISWACEASVIYFSLRAFGLAADFTQLIFAISVSGLLGALSMIPGGVGVADGTLLGLLSLCGIEKTAAGTVTIISRFSTMWFGVLVGCLLLLKNKSILRNLLE